MSFVNGIVKCLSEITERKEECLNHTFETTKIDEQEQIACRDLFDAGCCAETHELGASCWETLMQKEIHLSNNNPLDGPVCIQNTTEPSANTPNIELLERRNTRGDSDRCMRENADSDLNVFGGDHDNLLLMCLNLKSENLSVAPKRLNNNDRENQSKTVKPLN